MSVGLEEKVVLPLAVDMNKVANRKHRRRHGTTALLAMAEKKKVCFFGVIELYI